jgi:hypothetical protein
LAQWIVQLGRITRHRESTDLHACFIGPTKIG